MKAEEESEYESYYCESGQEAEDHTQKHKKAVNNLSAEQSMNEKSVEISKEQIGEQRPPAVHRK